jgi:CHAT domain-containing protein
MLNSGLILSINDDTGNDGYLTAYEASTLNLGETYLVVLSACKTGLGSIRDGEGIFGLQRAFEAAGVNNILISLWNVDDRATQEFMQLFYCELVKNYDVLKSFNQAQLSLRKIYPDPNYWGAFKLISTY